MGYLAGDEAKNFDLKDFFEKQAIEYPKLGTNAGAVRYANGALKYRGNVGCHGYMAGWLHGDHQSYWTTGAAPLPVEAYASLWSHDYNDTVLEYFRFLTNKKFSPWRSILKGSEVIWGKKGEKDIPVAVKLTDMSVSGQTVMNFMLACRMAYAQPGLITCYGKLREAGFTRTEAVFLSASFGLNKSNTPNWPYIGDYPYDTAFTDMDWEMWKSGKPRATGDITTTSPINAIWNEEKNKSSGIVIHRHSTKKNNRICDLISEEKEIVNMFGTPEKRRYPMSFDKAVEVLKANEEVWKCRPKKQESTSQAEEQTNPISFLSSTSSIDTGIQPYLIPTIGTTHSFSTAHPSV